MYQILNGAAIWGLLGSAIFAFPRASTCYFSARKTGDPWAVCIVDCLIALPTGAVGAAAFAPWLANFMHVKDMRAVATVIGLIANPLVPILVNFLVEKVMKRFMGGA